MRFFRAVQVRYAQSVSRNGTGLGATGPRFHTLKKACGIERLAPERRGLSLRARVQRTMVLPSLLVCFSRRWPGCSSNARVERGPSEGARSASRRTTRSPLPSASDRRGRGGAEVRGRILPSLLIGQFQTGRIISTAASRSILSSADTFPSRSFRTIRSIWTIAPRCQPSTAAF